MVESRMAVVDGLRMHYLVAGSGPVVVLLHGWPQTSHCWRKVIGPLAEDHTVIAPDLRGYGRTDKPRSGYDKRTMAGDIRRLMRGITNEPITLVGHDRGARIAHRYALDHGDEISRLVVLDIIPTREMWRRFDMDSGLARECWHWTFHLQPDLPELLAGKDVRGYLEYFFERWTVNRTGLADGAIDEYVQAFTRPGALRAGFDDYRASFPDDAAHDENDFGRRLQMPVLALWGEFGFPARLPTLDIWREYAVDVRGGPVIGSGHFIAEEKPDTLLAELTVFFEAT